MRVSIKIFVHEHGTAPRGFGVWAFTYGVTPQQAKYYGIRDAPIIEDKDNPHRMVWFPQKEHWKAMKYSEAKEKALAYGREIRFKGTIYLLS